jgi:small subunit ribosomal protein S6
MRKYELMTIFPVEDDQRAAGQEKFLADIAQAGMQIEKTDDLGDKDLAYEIGKRRRGRYVLYHILAEPTTLKDVDKVFKLNANLVRYLFVRKDGE